MAGAWDEIGTRPGERVFERFTRGGDRSSQTLPLQPTPRIFRSDSSDHVAGSGDHGCHELISLGLKLTLEAQAPPSSSAS